MKNTFPGGVWPVMLTPFTADNRVDYKALGSLIDWYIGNGVSGLFADCQSSEMFFLSLEERVEIARFVKQYAAGRVPVIASGHISDAREDQIRELNAIAATGVDAVILLTNRMAKQEESDEVWLKNLQILMDSLPADKPLGFYECPYPYKRVLSRAVTKWCAESGRFFFLKDTSCDLHSIADKLEVCRGTNLRLYNANTATLLESLDMGAAGYSGVLANMQASLYAKLTSGTMTPQLRRELADDLSICCLIERQVYPVNAKYYLSALEGLPMTTVCRTRSNAELNETAQMEVRMLGRVTERMKKKYL